MKYDNDITKTELFKILQELDENKVISHDDYKNAYLIYALYFDTRLRFLEQMQDQRKFITDFKENLSNSSLKEQEKFKSIINDEDIFFNDIHKSFLNKNLDQNKDKLESTKKMLFNIYKLIVDTKYDSNLIKDIFNHINEYIIMLDFWMFISSNYTNICELSLHSFNKDQSIDEVSDLFIDLYSIAYVKTLKQIYNFFATKYTSIVDFKEYKETGEIIDEVLDLL